MDSTSSFSEVQLSFPDAELLQVGGTTCECYRVKLYGKLHFLKQLKSELCTNPQFVAAMQKEFQMGYVLDHPHLVRFVAKTDNGILMDYVDGETLSQFIEHHPGFFNDRKNTDRFLRQLLSVVGYLHSHQVIHLDLKPSNILITRIGHDVKLIDLGYCYADCYTDTTGRTDKYAAPEQTDGSARPDTRTDIYAIGRIMQTLPCARKYNKVIKRCTEMQMSQRYDSVDELLQAVQHRRNPWLLVVLAFVFVCMGVFLLFRQSHRAFDASSETNPSPQQNSQVVKESHNPSKQVDSATFPATSPIEDSRTSLSENSETAPTVVPPVASITQPEDTMALRRELQQLIGPRFKKALGHYSDSIYYHINQERFTKDWIHFENSVRPLYTQVWQKYKSKISQSTMDSEWCQTLMYYQMTQFWKMMRNDPGHDPFYDGKEFHYYEVPCS